MAEQDILHLVNNQLKIVETKFELKEVVVMNFSTEHFPWFYYFGWKNVPSEIVINLSVVQKLHVSWANKILYTLIAGSQKSSWIRPIKCLKKSLLSWGKNGHLSDCKRREWDRKACGGYGEFMALISGQCCVFQVFSVSTKSLFSLYYLAVNGHVKGLLSFSLLLHQLPAYCHSLSLSLSPATLQGFI